MPDACPGVGRWGGLVGVGWLGVVVEVRWAGGGSRGWEGKREGEVWRRGEDGGVLGCVLRCGLDRTM